MKLQEKLDQMKAEFESGAPPEALAVMHKTTEDLKQSGLMENALKTGDILPGFSLARPERQTGFFRKIS